MKEEKINRIVEELKQSSQKIIVDQNSVIQEVTHQMNHYTGGNISL